MAIIVSNHGGRHFDGAPASIDVLPASWRRSGRAHTVMIDSGIRSGLDVCVRSRSAPRRDSPPPVRLRPGRARSDRGRSRGRHVLRRDSHEFTHTGVRSVVEAAEITARHPGAWSLAG